MLHPIIKWFRQIPSLALIAILGCAAFVRFYRLGRPDSLVFDEVYYVDGARDFLKYGVEVTGNDPEIHRSSCYREMADCSWYSAIWRYILWLASSRRSNRRSKCLAYLLDC